MRVAIHVWRVWDTPILRIARGGLRCGWGCERAKQRVAAKSRRRKRYSSDRNQPGVAQVVTTVWRTKLGTMLWIGLKLQHHCWYGLLRATLSLTPAYRERMDRAKFLSGLAPRHAGGLLWRNSPPRCWESSVYAAGFCSVGTSWYPSCFAWHRILFSSLFCRWASRAAQILSSYSICLVTMV